VLFYCFEVFIVFYHRAVLMMIFVAYEVIQFLALPTKMKRAQKGLLEWL
jgi:hypothetical protein